MKKLQRTLFVFLFASKILALLLLLFFYQTSFINAAERPPLQLANLYEGDINLKDYFVSEKFDGVRAYFDGKKFISRQGNIIKAPAWFIKNFPKEILDGELWISRGNFELVSGIVRQEIPDDEAWKQVKYMVFDLPKDPQVFAERLLRMHEIIASGNLPHLQMVRQFKVRDQKELENLLAKTVKNGGEGLMLHKGSALYKAERNDDLMKVKTYQDAEAMVVDYVAGKGKYDGLVGALLVKNEDGEVFKLGTGLKDEQRKNPPKIGSIVTYKYYGKTKNNIPRFASFLRDRVE